MPAISHPDYARFEHGPLPFEIFGYEPLFAEGGNHPIPTEVNITDSTAKLLDETAEVVVSHFQQELSSEGRLIATIVNGLNIVERTWGEDGSFVDNHPATKMNRKRSVTRLGEHRWHVEEQDGQQIDIEESVDENGNKLIISRSSGQDEEVVETDIDSDGRVVLEKGWDNPSEYRDGFFQPTRETTWEYDEMGKLMLMTSSAGGANVHPREEFYRRNPANVLRKRNAASVLRVVAFRIPEPTPLIAVDQVREYDSTGRLEVVRGLVSNSDSPWENPGPTAWVAELDYS